MKTGKEIVARDTKLKERLTAYHRFVPDETLRMIGIDRIEQVELGNQDLRNGHPERRGCRRYRADGTLECTGELDQEVPWRDEYALDVPKIASEHRQLLDCINGLLREIHRGNTNRLEDSLAFLGRYTAHRHLGNFLHHRYRAASGV